MKPEDTDLCQRPWAGQWFRAHMNDLPSRPSTELTVGTTDAHSGRTRSVETEAAIGLRYESNLVSRADNCFRVGGWLQRGRKLTTHRRGGNEFPLTIKIRNSSR